MDNEQLINQLLDEWEQNNCEICCDTINAVVLRLRNFQSREAASSTSNNTAMFQLLSELKHRITVSKLEIKKNDSWYNRINECIAQLKQ